MCGTKEGKKHGSVGEKKNKSVTNSQRQSFVDSLFPTHFIDSSILMLFMADVSLNPTKPGMDGNWESRSEERQGKEAMKLRKGSGTDQVSL